MITIERKIMKAAHIMSVIKCNDDIQRALEHIRQNDLETGIRILKKYEGCHQTNFICPHFGENCAIQDLITGFVMLQKNSGEP